MLFFSVTQLLDKPIMKPVAIIFSILCLLGYPLNNTVFGFSYLGAGVTYCFAFMAVVNLVCRSRLRKTEIGIGIGILSLFFYSTLISYNLFIPVEVIFLFGLFLLFLRSKGFSCRGILVVIVLAIFVGIAGVAAILEWGGVKGLTTDGYIYKDLFWSFMPIVPLTIYGVFQDIKKNNGIDSLFIFSIITCVIGSLVLFLLGYFSSYYYYKFYYLFWVAAFYLGSKGFSELVQKKDLFAIIYSLFIVVLFVVTITGIDSKISNKYPTLTPPSGSNSLFGVYTFNFNQMNKPAISDDEIELFRKGDEFSRITGEYIPMVGTNIDVYWHEAITQVRNDDRKYYYYWLYDCDDQQNELIDRLSSAQHLIVLNNQEISQPFGKYLSGKEIVFSNSAGSLYFLRN